MGVVGAALVWGFAEATLFFFVPDILITRIALADLRRALWACFWSLLGAVSGGAVRTDSAEFGYANQ